MSEKHSMQTTEPKTIQEALQMALQALLRGDLAERDRLCKIAQSAFRPGETDAPGNRPLLDETRGSS
jgi:hypothetical protein